jgi:hypothetical protein|tara:strand:+ start:1893 stop:2126 length:234 start_codon:yes stop_codon:yes gene_type:complete
MTPQEFFKLLTDHDWTYNYSDDHRAWEKGKNESHRLQAIIQEVPLYTKMYNDYSDYVFKRLYDDASPDKPKIEDYLC